MSTDIFKSPLYEKVIIPSTKPDGSIDYEQYRRLLEEYYTKGIISNEVYEEGVEDLRTRIAQENELDPLLEDYRSSFANGNMSEESLIEFAKDKFDAGSIGLDTYLYIKDTAGITIHELRLDQENVK